MGRVTTTGRRHRVIVGALAVSLLGLMTPAPAPVLAVVQYGGLVPPVIVGPAPYAVSGAPTLEWQAVPGAISYFVEIMPVPSTTFGTCGGDTEVLRMTCDWLAPGPYTWTVRAIGPENRSGPPSIARPFTKSPRALDAPTILAPASGAVFDYPDALGMLRWSAVPYGAYYQVQVSDEATFPGETPDPTYASIPTEGISVPFEVPGRRQYWRVRAVSHHKHDVGPWSAVRSYTVRWPAPTPTAPDDGATVSNVVLTWDAGPGTNRFDIQIAPLADTTFAEPYFTDSARASHYAFPGAVESPFRWRVRARNSSGGATAWSTARTVTVDPGGDPMVAPDVPELTAPALLGPANGATNIDLEATPLRWTSVPGTIAYDLQIVEDGQPWYGIDGYAPNHLGPPLAAPNLDQGVTYRWRVRANDSDGLYRAGPWSPERTFTTIPRAAVVLTSPADGATVSYEDLFVRWTAPAVSPIFFTEFSQSPDFADALIRPGYRDGRIETRMALTPGTWYWRVKAGNDNIEAISPTRTVNVVDDVGPAAAISGDTPSTTAESITLGTGLAEDTVSDIDRFAASPDGLSWTEAPYREPVPWSLVSLEHGGPAYGLRTVWLKWRDTAGNWSTPRTWQLWYGPAPEDTTPPTVTPPRAVGIVPASAIPSSGSIPVRLTWTGTDARSPMYYELTRRIGVAGGNASVLKDYTGPPTIDQLLPAGQSYTYTLRGRDERMNTTDYAVGPTFTVARYGETSSAIRYTGSWASSSSSSFWGGTTRRSLTAGATASLTFTGRSVGLVSFRAPDRGAATIYVNGIKVAIIDLYARTKHARQIVWSMDWSTSATRTVTVRVAGTPGRARFDIDGFVTVR